jgi:hypothetical protein
MGCVYTTGTSLSGILVYSEFGILDYLSVFLSGLTSSTDFSLTVSSIRSAIILLRSFLASLFLSFSPSSVADVCLEGGCS